MGLELAGGLLLVRFLSAYLRECCDHQREAEHKPVSHRDAKNTKQKHKKQFCGLSVVTYFWHSRLTEMILGHIQPPKFFFWRLFSHVFVTLASGEWGIRPGFYGGVKRLKQICELPVYIIAQMFWIWGWFLRVRGDGDWVYAALWVIWGRIDQNHPCSYNLYVLKDFETLRCVN